MSSAIAAAISAMTSTRQQHEPDVACLGDRDNAQHEGGRRAKGRASRGSAIV
jgi:hypothetical protein